MICIHHHALFLAQTKIMIGENKDKIRMYTNAKIYREFYTYIFLNLLRAATEV